MTQDCEGPQIQYGYAKTLYLYIEVFDAIDRKTILACTVGHSCCLHPFFPGRPP